MNWLLKPYQIIFYNYYHSLSNNDSKSYLVIICNRYHYDELVNVCIIYSVLKVKVEVNIDSVNDRFSGVGDVLRSNKNSNIKLFG